MFLEFTLCMAHTIYTYVVMSVTIWVNHITHEVILLNIFKLFVTRVGMCQHGFMSGSKQ